MTTNSDRQSQVDRSAERWPTFWEILQALHQEGILIHPEQLAEFLLRHGLPVDLCYVPRHLQEKAKRINANYQGDMARLDDRIDEQFCSFGEFSLGYTSAILNHK